eukprot:TRINITY_DN20333_c0_g1_i4.p1 TRINITY_DN20333_c0_g1~~TRINITY_DN20333_c0_g1_i4.p1  ORF type:complete len:398 (-),score=92.06 TRINITY_DN20333_c0_g1_i4:66-1259(-)
MNKEGKLSQKFLLVKRRGANLDQEVTRLRKTLFKQIDDDLRYLVNSNRAQKLEFEYTLSVENSTGTETNFLPTMGPVTQEVKYPIMEEPIAYPPEMRESDSQHHFLGHMTAAAEVHVNNTNNVIGGAETESNHEENNSFSGIGGGGLPPVPVSRSTHVIMNEAVERTFNEFKSKWEAFGEKYLAKGGQKEKYFELDMGKIKDNNIVYSNKLMRKYNQQFKEEVLSKENLHNASLLTILHLVKRLETQEHTKWRVKREAVLYCVMVYGLLANYVDSKLCDLLYIHFLFFLSREVVTQEGAKAAPVVKLQPFAMRHLIGMLEVNIDPFIGFMFDILKEEKEIKQFFGKEEQKKVMIELCMSTLKVAVSWMDVERVQQIIYPQNTRKKRNFMRLYVVSPF